MFYEKKINNDGFTLNELIVVIVIISAIAAFAIPRFTATFEATRIGEGIQILDSLSKAQKTFNFENPGIFADDLDKLDVEIPNSTNFENIIVSNNAAAVATIDRMGGLYTLSIDDAGLITCADGTIECTKVGCGGAGGACNQ